MIDERIGAYLVQRQLGAGGMGTVYEACVVDAVDGLAPGDRVAIKVVHPHLTAAPGFLARFRREAELGRGVVHPNVVRTLEFGGAEGGDDAFPYVVLELVTGQTLSELRAELGRVPEDLCRHIATEITRGLGAMHDVGIVHRDLKPANVLITADHVVKVMDLGLARQASGEDRLSRTGQFVGTAYYAPPEQFRGQAELDPRGDLYSLGVLLYELATGRPPFSGDSLEAIMREVLEKAPPRPCELNPQISPYFEHMLLSLLAKSPTERPSSAALLLDALDGGEDGSWWAEEAARAPVGDGHGRPRVDVARETDVVGRADELEALLELAHSGDAHVVLVEGEAGVGKTRLMDEFIERLGGDATILYGAYSPGGAATQSGALVAAFRDHIGVGRLDAGAIQLLQAAPGLVPAFTALLRGDAPPTDVAALTAESMRTAFLHALRALASERPTVLIVDDLSSAPAEGRELLTSLALGIQGHPVLLVGTTRPGLPSDWLAELTRREHVERRVLPRLSEEDVTELLSLIIGSSVDALRLADNVRARVGGNPFFLFEMIRALRERGVLAQGVDGSWRSVTRTHAMDLPDGVRDLLRARLDRVTDDDRCLLECAACCGVRFDARWVAEALGTARIPALRALGRLEREHGLVRADGGRFVFDHHALREAIYAGLADSLREEYHAALADALEARTGAGAQAPGEVDGALSKDLCLNFLKGGVPDRAMRYLDAGLQHLQHAGLYAEASELADRAIAAPSGLVGEQRLATALRGNELARMLGRLDRQEAHLDEALSVATELGDPVSRARVNVAFGVHMRDQGLADEAEERLRAAAEDAAAEGARRVEMTATSNLGVVLESFGRFEEARTAYRRWMELARILGDRRQESSSLGKLGEAWLVQGRSSEAEHYFQQQLALVREIGFKLGETNAIGNLGRLAMEAGDMATARERFEHQARLAREIGDRRNEIVGDGNVSTILIETGHYEEARQIVEQLVALAREMGSRAFESVGTGNLGSIAFHLGQFAESRRWSLKHRELAREIGDGPGEMLAIGNLGVGAFMEGKYDEACRLYEERLALARGLDDDRNIAAALGHIASAREAMGDRDGAEEWSRRAVTAQRALGRRAELAFALTLLAQTLITAERPDEARPLLQEAVAVSRDADSPRHLVVAQLCLAQIGAGSPRVARETLERTGDRIGRRQRLYLRFGLWKLERSRDDLVEAYELLSLLAADTEPAEWEGIVARVSLYGEVRDAWRADEDECEAATVVAD